MIGYVLLALFTLVLLSMMGIGMYRFSLSMKRLHDERSGHTVDNFLHEFDGENIPKRVLAEVFHWFIESSVKCPVPPHRGDLIGETLGIDEDDFEYMVMAILKNCGCQVDVSGVAKICKDINASDTRKRKTTVDDLVHLVHQCYRSDVSLNEFSEPEVNVVQHTSGFSVKVLGRTGILYREHDRSMKVDSEVLAARGIALYTKSIRAWDPPYQDIPVTADDKSRIVSNIVSAIGYLGGFVVVS